MDRMACVDVPAFPLQLLLIRHPDWVAHPAVVVEHDRPQGVILWANERALRQRILPGMRYAEGLSLASDLRAGVIGQSEIDEAVRSLIARLQRLTPDVEPSSGEPGVFWLNASGLGLLYPSLEAWGLEVHGELARSGLHSTVVVGFSRFGTYALARGMSGTPRREVVELASEAEEKRRVERVSMEALGIAPALRDTLERLGIRTVGAFLSLPAGGLRRRFGEDAFRMHQLATGARWTPMSPSAAEVPVARRAQLEHPEQDVSRLLRVIERLIEPLLKQVASRGEAVVELSLHLELERLRAPHQAWAPGEPAVERRVERFRPAAPTLDGGQLLGLVRLRLEAQELGGGVREVALTLAVARATREQLRLFLQRPRRDLRAADQALARIRAELGEQAVVRARLKDAHLPEASFSWEPLEHVVLPRPAGAASSRTLVRRILTRPMRLPARSRHEPDGWLVLGAGHGHVVRCDGPYVVSGGWWVSPVHREYHMAETRDGTLLWMYYDRRRDRWFLQGRVE